MERPPEFLKSFANRLGRLAAEEDGLRLLRRLHLTDILGAGPDAARTAFPGGVQDRVSPGATASGKVGIWEKKEEAGKAVFVRSPHAIKTWHYWADVERIGPKGSKRRIILTGESVARGYLYDPEYTPAMVLEKVLESELGKDEVEVIDLARNGIGLEIGELIKSTLLLEPDVVVIYACNNWRGFYPPRRSHVPFIDTALREQGIAGIKRFADYRLEMEARRMIEDVSAVCAAAKIPLVWIVPESNLGDWREPLTNAPHLPGDANRAWLDYHAAAQNALQNSDIHRASELAGKMIKLDGGICVAPLYILAECGRLSQNPDSTRAFLELARDSVVWDPSKSFAARPQAVSQRALREEVSKRGGGLVDMPGLLKEHLSGGIPDRRLFIDYCHMTSEGIQIGMAAAAACLLRTLGVPEISWQVLLDRAPAPTPETEAATAFLAAIHNAHGGQSSDVVHYHCERAVRLSPKIAESMLCFLGLQTRRAPMLLCKEAEQIAKRGSLIGQYILNYNHQQLDVLLTQGIVDALRQAGIDAGQRLNQLRREEHSVVGREIDLLDYYFNSAALQPQEIVWVLPRYDRSLRREADYYRAYGSESKFIFIGEEQHAVQLQLTCRLPGIDSSSESSVVLRVNENFLTELSAGGEWGAFDIDIPAHMVKNGLNEITVCWPVPEFPGERAYEEISDDLALGIVPEFYCCFGEIHTLMACDGSTVKSEGPLMDRKLTEIEA